MLVEDRIEHEELARPEVPARPPQAPPRRAQTSKSSPRPVSSRAETSGPGLAWRIVLLLVGFALASIGWTLVMSVFLVFIGLPLFFFGIALMQAQER